MGDGTDLDRDSADELLELAERQDEPRPAEWYANELGFDGEATARQIASWMDSGWMVEVLDSDGNRLYGGEPVGSDPFDDYEFLLRELNEMVMFDDFAEAKPVSWFGDELDVPHWQVHWVLQDLEEMDGVISREIDDTALYAPPHVEVIGDTPQLFTTRHDTVKLVYPDGESHDVTVTERGGCTVARPHGTEPVAVFVDGEFSFATDDGERISHVAISERGYLAYHAGDHRESVFHVTTWDGETVYEEAVEVARPPAFTPDGRHVAFWRLTDEHVYCYDLDPVTRTGRFDSTRLRQTNIGIDGVVHGGEQAVRVSDTYGPGSDEVLAYLSPTGDLRETVVDDADAEAPTDSAPSDSEILDEIMREFDAPGK